MTFSISARCERTGQFGVAVSSSSPAVAARCAHARAGVGAVATQNVTDPTIGPRGLTLMAEVYRRMTRSSRSRRHRRISIIVKSPLLIGTDCRLSIPVHKRSAPMVLCHSKTGRLPEIFCVALMCSKRCANFLRRAPMPISVIG